MVEPFIMPTRKPSTGNRALASKPNMEMRIGREIAIAIGPPRPGVAPTMTPNTNPKNTIVTVIEIGIGPRENTGSAVKTATIPSQI
jgi:hypothetical protein